MKKSYYFAVIFALLLASATSIFSQEFDFQAYKANVDKIKDANYQTLSNYFPSGTFLYSVTKPTSKIAYLDSMKNVFQLTPTEISLINKNGFVVTDRTYNSIGSAFLDIFHDDLPVFISADAILHSMHFSYNNILTFMEENIFIDSIRNITESIKNEIPKLDAKYGNDPLIKQSLLDLDIYLSVPLKILDQYTNTYYPQNDSIVNALLGFIESQMTKDIALFGDEERTIDFSRFKPRAHYTSSERLKKYFKAMVWLTTTEISISPVNIPIEQKAFVDLRRRIIMSQLLSEAFHSAKISKQYDNIVNVLKLLIGSSDNTTVYNFDEVISDAKFNSVTDLKDSLKILKFCEILKTKPFATQRILSQIVSNFGSEAEPNLSASIALFGSIFTIDSYILSQTVYPFVDCRDFPSTQDVLFGLGNNASLQFLAANPGKYFEQIGKLRYLIDGQKEEYWSSSLYNNWLGSIRTMNTPSEANRNALPEFMQTASWWQRMMNTQLGSWAQLRHDNLLYVKQSYSGGVTCSFPYGYVDPYPALYKSIAKYTELASAALDSLSTSNYGLNSIKDYYRNLNYSAKLFDTIATNELAGIPLSKDQISYLKWLVSDQYKDCGGSSLWGGWYPKLFVTELGFSSGELNEGPGKIDYTIADIHTVPTDCNENPIGAVMHVGVGPFKLMILTAKQANGETIAYAGPVFGYYEVTTKNNFQRLTDEEWSDMINKNSTTTSIPPFTLLYSSAGANLSNNISLKTYPVIVENPENPVGTQLYLSCSPNPINGISSAIVSFRISAPNYVEKYDLSIYDELGNLIKVIDSGNANSTGNIVKFELNGASNSPLSSGVYFIKLKYGELSETTKVIINK